jgi:hypothetical protein
MKTKTDYWLSAGKYFFIYNECMSDKVFVKFYFLSFHGRRVSTSCLVNTVSVQGWSVSEGMKHSTFKHKATHGKLFTTMICSQIFVSFSLFL